MKTLIFDSQMNILASGEKDEDYSYYIPHVQKVIEEGRGAYVYSSPAGQDIIIYFSPIILEGKCEGVLILNYLLKSAELAASSLIRLFTFAALAAVVCSAGLYLLLHHWAVKSLRMLAAYFREISEDENAEFPKITYNKKDTVGRLVGGYEMMQRAMDEKISELNYEKEKLSAIIGSMQDAVIAVEEGGKIVGMNDKVALFFKGAEAISEIIPDYDEVIRLALADPTGVSCEIEYNSKNFLANAVRINSSPRGEGVLFVISDVTAIKKANSEQNRFFSSISHELRTPLTTVIGYINMLIRRGTADSKLTEKALMAMDGEAHRLLRLVNDLVTMGKIKKYEFALVMSDINLNVLLSEVASQMDMTGTQNNIAVTYESVELPIIKGDRDRLKQAFLNVTDNAVKYSHPGDAVRLRAIKMEGFVEVTVRDYGEGIPADKLERVFEAFYRVEDDRIRLGERGGYGLGLSIVKDIIEGHGGSVEIESVEGEGTLAVIRLPYKNPRQSEPAKTPQEDEESGDSEQI